ncbi:polysaccharide deacetylase family protein [Aestuariivivens insulae]|uniref:polysaccharide deacetylase family protein n=1 Tax=Aestuariivivens insulae TaxID=1621988 RepID=UPI001F58044E|nr:polysaccharide deacetylase family protein [Aestuariivivens insulae]
MLTALFLGVNGNLLSQENIATKLGYSEDSKLLIIHADDLGVSHSENMATFKAIEKGSVNSASVMMPAPWALEAVTHAKSNPDTHDFGVHLVLSSEWKHYKWGPVSSKGKVPSLIDEYGYFHEACRTDLNLKEVEEELKAQVDLAYAMGFEPTHLDPHMGCVLQTRELTELYLKIGKLYHLPVLVVEQLLTPVLKDKYNVRVVVDYFYNLTPETFAKGEKAYYVRVLKNLKPGLSYFSIHTAYDNEEMKGMTFGHPDWGSVWRQKDFNFFTSETCKELLKKENIKLVTWRQIKKAFY